MELRGPCTRTGSFARTCRRASVPKVFVTVRRVLKPSACTAVRISPTRRRNRGLKKMAPLGRTKSLGTQSSMGLSPTSPRVTPLTGPPLVAEQITKGHCSAGLESTRSGGSSPVSKSSGTSDLVPAKLANWHVRKLTEWLSTFQRVSLYRTMSPTFIDTPNTKAEDHEHRYPAIPKPSKRHLLAGLVAGSRVSGVERVCPNFRLTKTQIGQSRICLGRAHCRRG